MSTMRDQRPIGGRSAGSRHTMVPCASRLEPCSSFAAAARPS